MSETTVGLAAAPTTEPPVSTCAGPVALALLDLVDALLSAGPERSHVLSAALEVALLDPTAADLDEVRAEVVAEHAATLQALSRVPGQRGAADPRTRFTDAADTLRARRLEVLDLARGLAQGR